MSINFNLLSTDTKSKARAGLLHTDHGTIETPIFMPVGTRATVKSVHQTELIDQIKAQIILGNTYHLFLRPGMEVMAAAGGLHKFMNWNRPILTDSGGYQVFSLSKIRKITEEGVAFRSHIDGSQQYLNPEIATDVQRIIGGDIIMAFDECTPYPCDKGYAEKSLRLTHRWLKRCFDRFKTTSHLYDHEQCLAPIIQGSVYKDLRSESADFVQQFESEVYAIGGLSVGEPADMMYEITDTVTDIMPRNKARYLMGVGTPANVLESIARGIDMMDCVLPTRNARHGLLYTTQGIVNIKNSKWQQIFNPIDSGLGINISSTTSCAYLHHLFKVKEFLGLQIASQQNLAFFLWLVREARKHIISGDFIEWKIETLEKIDRRL